MGVGVPAVTRGGPPGVTGRSVDRFRCPPLDRPAIAALPRGVVRPPRRLRAAEKALIAATLIAEGRTVALALGDRLAELAPAPFHARLHEHVAYRHADTARQRHELDGLMRGDLRTAVQWRRVEVRVILTEVEDYNVAAGLGEDLADVRERRRAPKRPMRS